MSDSKRDDDQLYRSHFLNADELVDGPSDQSRAAYRLGQRADDGGRGQTPTDPIEKEVDNGWLNIRVRGGEWASVRDLARVRADRTQQGRITDAPPPSEWSEQPSYADPVADGMDPTAPDSPESRF